MSEVDRETLYKEVWAEPMTTVAARYGISSSYLARVCERMNVPRPERGHWAKLAAGKPSPQKPLPDPEPGDELSWSRGGDPSPWPRLPRQNVRRRKQRIRGHGEESSQEHPLVAGAIKHFDKVRETEEGYLRPYKRLLVDVYVTRTMVERVLAVANALFKEFEARGYRVTLAPRDELLWCHDFDEREQPRTGNRFHSPWRPDRPTVVYVDGVAFGLTLFEISESVEVAYMGGKYVPVRELSTRQSRHRDSRFQWTTHKDRPTGRLCLQAYSPYPQTEWTQQWRESVPGQLERRSKSVIRTLREAVPTIVALVDKARQEAEDRQREWDALMRRLDEEERERRRQLALKESTDELLGIIDAWSAARSREAFFRDAEERAKLLDDPRRDHLLERIRRARELAGAADPLEQLQQWKSPDERYPGK